MAFEEIKQDVDAYYTHKVLEHGPTHHGVDWNSTASQVLRYQQLIRGFSLKEAAFSINDYGCGWGGFYGFLQEQCRGEFTYTGYDISQAMVDQAKQLYGACPQATFHHGDRLMEQDYTMASGIFNVRLKQSSQTWQHYVLSCLEKINAASRKGFAFNLLSTYSDIDYRKEYLYYGDPCFFLDYAKTHFSRHVTLFHDYGLYEFTLAVTKDPGV